jgi:hypothetical protein
MKKFKTSFLFFVLIVIVLASPIPAKAEGVDGAPLNLEISVDVPQTCDVVDADGVTHTYTATSTDSYIAICGVAAALTSGSLSDVEFSNAFPSLGLFVTSINDVAADPSSQYWALFKNDGFADLGLSSLPIAANDTIKLELRDFSDNVTGDFVILHINSLVQPSTGGGSGSGSTERRRRGSTRNTSSSGEVLGASTEAMLDRDKALKFLLSKQNADGGFGELMYTDWVTLALVTGNNQNEVIKLIRHHTESKPVLDRLTDYERHAMALMSLGLNPHNTQGVNYIEKILSTYSSENKQFGELIEDNDDTFALIVLKNAGYDETDSRIVSSLAFVLGRQWEDGSWDGSVDMTGATIAMLSNFTETDVIKNAMAKGRTYLKNTQERNGSWNNSLSSTAWALEGIKALKEKPENWENKYKSPLDYLLGHQDTDGGMKNLSFKEEPQDLNTQIWQTAYVVSALAPTTWNERMQKWSKLETATPAAN